MDDDSKKLEPGTYEVEVVIQYTFVVEEDDECGWTESDAVDEAIGEGAVWSWSVEKIEP